MNENTINQTSKIDITAFCPRERVLAAALKLFVEQGYFNTNIPDLSRESKCSVGSIYHTFKNKEEVAVSLYIEGLLALRSSLYKSIEYKSETEDIIKTLVYSFLEFSQLNHQLSKYMWLCRHNEFMSGVIKHPTKVGFDKLGRKLAKLIKDGIRNNKIRPLHADVVWSIIFGIPLSFVRDWLDGYTLKTPKDLANEIADSCWRALTI